MTRDEADRIVTSTPGFVDTLVLLGVLKLDEPKSAYQRAREQFRNESLSPCDGEIYLGAIERAGLKIVEK